MILFFLVFVAFSAGIFYVIRKARQRSEINRQREEQFILAMRHDPGSVMPGSAASAPFTPSGSVASIPPIAPMPMQPTARPAAVQATSDHASVYTSAARPVPPPPEASGAWAIPGAVAALVPGSSVCPLCSTLVDLKSNRPEQWGVKIPDETGTRVLWYHFSCLNRVLARYGELEARLVQGEQGSAPIA